MYGYICKSRGQPSRIEQSIGTENRVEQSRLEQSRANHSGHCPRGQAQWPNFTLLHMYIYIYIFEGGPQITRFCKTIIKNKKNESVRACQKTMKM